MLRSFPLPKGMVMPTNVFDFAFISTGLLPWRKDKRMLCRTCGASAQLHPFTDRIVRCSNPSCSRQPVFNTIELDGRWAIFGLYCFHFFEPGIGETAEENPILKIA